MGGPMRNTAFVGLLLLLALGCRTTESGADSVNDVAGDTWWHGGGVDAFVDDDTVAPLEDIAPEEDLGPPNTAPTFTAPAPVSLDQGASTTIDLAGLVSDAEDDLDLLTLEWSADHVGLQLQDGWQLYIVAPVDWAESEVIDLTVTDTGGLSATAPLKVIVTEVTIVDPPPPDECKPTLFAHDAGTNVSEVLLSGSFNDWGGDADHADIMTDPDGDGIWEVELDLEPGKYLYKFIVDGTWIRDPANDHKEDDGYGKFNSVIEVPECDE